ncbi:hypothetical protein AN618_04280 [Fervidicola ferrireducens]|uniref:Polymerase beta nucleotidyltransferase domain-containing protein n=1 Tax=Fervidicola ferrireducens TaxID=520764 RepID=A0A140LCT7_9FIRM|nr:nucleotidyltransferase domain-containing protein [Fervidicola ferrireducens]KXG78362.1 hypothetical protein AN618_04280 [Fervidicola ferrireducens]
MLREKSFGSVKILSVDYNALIEALKKSIKKIYESCPEVKKVFLFGSFARRDYTPESDVDLMIITDRADGPFLARADRYVDFFRAIPLDVNIIVYTEEELDKMKKNERPFIAEVFKYAVELK